MSDKIPTNWTECEQRGFTGMQIRAGAISVYISGAGITYGPMTNDQMRQIAARIWATAAQTDARDQAVGDRALAELEALSTAGDDHDDD